MALGRFSVGRVAMFKLSNVVALHVPQARTEGRYAQLDECCYVAIPRARAEELLRAIDKSMKTLCKPNPINPKHPLSPLS